MSAAEVNPSPEPGSLADRTAIFWVGGWLVDPVHRRLVDADVVVKIEPRNLRVLQVLAERQGKVVSAREIESLAWEGVIVTSDSVYQSISRLRQALGDTKAPPTYIETVPRK